MQQGAQPLAAVAPSLGSALHQKPRKVKGMGKLQKSDIGSPSNFKHVTHVGWDPHSGFDLIGAQESLKPFLEKAGVGDQHVSGQPPPFARMMKFIRFRFFPLSRTHVFSPKPSGHAVNPFCAYHS